MGEEEKFKELREHYDKVRTAGELKKDATGRVVFPDDWDEWGVLFYPALAARLAKGNAVRHSLDELLAAAGLDRAELEKEIEEDNAVLRELAPYDHTFQVTAWKTSRREPYWFLSIECPEWALSDSERGYWGTQTPWLCLAEYMAKDYLVCTLDLDYKHWDSITVNVTRGIGPGFDESPYRWSSWLCAQYEGVKDTISKWRVLRDVRRRNR